MFWPMTQLVLAFCGVAVLGVLAVRVGIEVRRFARAVGEGAERIGAAADRLERSARPLAARGGSVRRTYGGNSAEE
ncbi:hypothetical protein [Streptomyces radicis]|uniref:Uncharacterized protein n=1 Tax=Streptomyces radicis TaxID=1750517 RepID=A0A3A9X2L2_9ACTN|nr:hypothetical protein [Streptomyces radicis]RKN12757.1 hypothetical protein D7319_02125 [Streptomyces radicis]RKN27479.1 hypothetical protein D7318_00770 [Streptomyces radicis]